MEEEASTDEESYEEESDAEPLPLPLQSRGMARKSIPEEARTDEESRDGEGTDEDGEPLPPRRRWRPISLRRNAQKEASTNEESHREESKGEESDGEPLPP